MNGMNQTREANVAYKRAMILKSSAPATNPLTALHSIQQSQLEVSQVTGMPFESPAAPETLAYDEITEQRELRSTLP
jgi:hypothetical protein